LPFVRRIHHISASAHRSASPSGRVRKY
jgi:hypothetical protein